MISFYVKLVDTPLWSICHLWNHDVLHGLIHLLWNTCPSRSMYPSRVTCHHDGLLCFVSRNIVHLRNRDKFIIMQIFTYQQLPLKIVPYNHRCNDMIFETILMKFIYDPNPLATVLYNKSNFVFARNLQVLAFLLFLRSYWSLDWIPWCLSWSF